MKYVWLGVLYCILVIVMGFHGYAASLEVSWVADKAFYFGLTPSLHSVFIESQ